MRTCAIVVVLRGVGGRAPGVGRRAGRRGTRAEARRRRHRRLPRAGDGEAERAACWPGRRRARSGRRGGRGCASEYFDMLGLWPLPEKTPLHRESHRHAGARRRDDRETVLPEPAGLVRHRRPVSSEKGRGQAAGDPLRLRPLQHGPRRQQDGLPGPRHVVRVERLRLPDHRHVAAGRDRRQAPRHLQPRPLVVALGRLHAGRRRVLERRPRHRLPREPAGRGRRSHRRHRHLRRRGGHRLDRGGRRARRSAPPRSAA